MTLSHNAPELKTMKHSIAMIGATGAVGTQVVKQLLVSPHAAQITLLGRRKTEAFGDFPAVKEHVVDVMGENPYADLLAGHDVAICTLGVGEPSKVSNEEFVAIDKTAVLTFARASKDAGIGHFQLLSSVGVDASSSSFYLRTKGELEAELIALKFRRLSFFHPSMILTPNNRYGLSQAIVLKTWPVLSAGLFGPLRKFRGIEVEHLGKAIAKNLFTTKDGVETLTWSEIEATAKN